MYARNESFTNILLDLSQSLGSIPEGLLCEQKVLLLAQGRVTGNPLLLWKTLCAAIAPAAPKGVPPEYGRETSTHSALRGGSIIPGLGCEFGMYLCYIS